MDVRCAPTDAFAEDIDEIHGLVLSSPPPPAGRLGDPLRRVCTRTVVLGRRPRRPVATLDPELLSHLRLDGRRDVRVVPQEVARVLAALADALAAEGVPGAGLLDDTVLGAEVDQLAVLRNTLAVEDAYLGLAERRRDLVLHDLDLGAAADHLVAVLDRAQATDVEAHRSVELERVAARGGLRIAEHHPDLHADLVDEDDDGA